MFKPISIIIPTQNSGVWINSCFKELLRYQRKHTFVDKIIFADNHSTDETIEGLMMNLAKAKNKTIVLILQPKTKSPRRILEIAVETCNTDNVIILEPSLNTCLGQIMKQNKKLNKADLILPNRLHKHSRTDYKPDLMQKVSHQLDKNFTGYSDLDNLNKAFRKDKFLPLIRTSPDWIELIKKAKAKRLRITETSTIWNSKKS
jgi:glycosyltransferase involved in cell wall biosynthesis